MKSRALLLIMLAFLIAAVPSFSDILHVPDEAESFSEAIENSAPNDTIMVSDGEYVGDNNYDLVVDLPLTIMSENGQDDCIISSVEDNAQYCFNVQSQVSIIGLTIVGFQVGIFADGINNLVIEDCFVTGSTATGINITDCEGVGITRCDISENNNTVDGQSSAGIFLSDVTGFIDQCVFSENTTLGRGAAIVVQSCSFVIQNSDIVGNTSRLHGGGILISNNNNLEIRNCLISGNVAEGFEDTRANGGGIALTAGDAIIDNCIITQNSAPTGSAGGLYCFNAGGECLISNTVFTENDAIRNGGGILIFQDASCEVLNCIFENNSAGIDGGGISVTSGSTIAVGNSDFIGNEAGLEVENGMGGGIYMGRTSTPVVTNSIFFENEADIGVQAYAQNAGQVTLSYCLIDGGVNQNDDWSMEGLSVEEIIDGDPVLSDGRDPDWGMNGFYLGEDSPCIDAGSGQAADLGFGEMSTQGDLSPDEDVIDLGYHYSVSNFAIFGRLSGVVFNVSNDEPLEGALVHTSFGQEAVTNEEGLWEIAEAFAMREFEITASMAGFLDSTLTELILEDGGELDVNFGLLHPEFEISHDQIVEQVEAGEQVGVEITIGNAGNAPLSWDADLTLRDVPDVEPWGFEQSLGVGEIIEDNVVGGVVYVDNHLFVSAGGGDPNMVHVMDMNGNLRDAFPQFGDSRDGMEDMSWDGELIWGTEDDMVYGFTTEGDVVESWEGPFNLAKYVAWDSDREVLWIAYTTSNIAGYNRQGERIIENDLPRGENRIYGLTYWAEDPDGHPLYILTRRVNDDTGYIYKMNPDDGDMLFVTELVLASGAPKSAFIANPVNPSVMSFMTIGDASVNDGGDRIDFFQISTNTAWMAVDPAAGIVAPEEEGGLTLTLMDDNFGEGDYLGMLTVTHDAMGGMVEIPITFSIGGGDRMPRDLVVSFDEGWNMISINIVPPQEMWEGRDGPDVRLMTEQLRIDEENHHISIFKNKTGAFYAPAWDFTNIPYWNLEEGYLVRVDEDVEATWNGVPIRPDADLPLGFGWNMVAYYPDYELSSSAPDFYVLSSIIDNVIIAKDVLGRFLNPAFRFSNMDPWRETQGYLIKIDADVVLTYPDEQGEERVADVETVLQNSTVFSSDNMSVLINSISGVKPELGDQVLAYNKDKILVGSGTFGENGGCGLAVWGIDLASGNSTGLRPDEAFELVFREAVSQMEYPIQMDKLLEGRGLTYETDGFTVLDVMVNTTVPDEYYLSQNYPNPFNSMTRLDYGLPETASVSIKAFDMNGRLAATVVDGKIKAGHHSAVINGSNLASGVYWIKLESNDFKAIRKVAMIK
ncbi:MAG: T9SS type A sorting domain-containing protein [Calditrichaeota bacterium]|nr:T9SS type A sorting domain-containing protein [Calditrichota bacterium]